MEQEFVSYIAEKFENMHHALVNRINKQIVEYIKRYQNMLSNTRRSIENIILIQEYILLEEEFHALCYPSDGVSAKLNASLLMKLYVNECDAFIENKKISSPNQTYKALSDLLCRRYFADFDKKLNVWINHCQNYKKIERNKHRVKKATQSALESPVPVVVPAVSSSEESSQELKLSQYASRVETLLLRRTLTPAQQEEMVILAERLRTIE